MSIMLADGNGKLLLKGWSNTKCLIFSRGLKVNGSLRKTDFLHDFVEQAEWVSRAIFDDEVPEKRTNRAGVNPNTPPFRTTVDF